MTTPAHRKCLLTIFFVLLHPFLISAISVNYTIDDEYGDSRTELKLEYQSGWKQGSTCGNCLIRLDHARVFRSTWHECSGFAHTGDTCAVTARFNGTAVYVYNILTSYGRPGTPYNHTVTKLFFDIDDIVHKTFYDTDDTTRYGVPVFKYEGLPNGMHTLSMHAPPNGPDTALVYVALDYIEYTTTEPDPEPITVASPTLPPSTSHTSTSSSITNSTPSSISALNFPTHASTHASTNLTTSSLNFSIISDSIVPSSTSSSISPPPADTSAPPHIQVVAVAGGVCGGVATGVAVFLGVYVFRKRRAARVAPGTSDAPSRSSESGCRATWGTGVPNSDLAPTSSPSLWEVARPCPPPPQGAEYLPSPPLTPNRRGDVLLPPIPSAADVSPERRLSAQNALPAEDPAAVRTQLAELLHHVARIQELVERPPEYSLGAGPPAVGGETGLAAGAMSTVGEESRAARGGEGERLPPRGKRPIL